MKVSVLAKGLAVNYLSHVRVTSEQKDFKLQSFKEIASFMTPL